MSLFADKSAVVFDLMDTLTPRGERSQEIPLWRQEVEQSLGLTFNRDVDAQQARDNLRVLEQNGEWMPYANYARSYCHAVGLKNVSVAEALAAFQLQSQIIARRNGLYAGVAELLCRLRRSPLKLGLFTVSSHLGKDIAINLGLCPPRFHSALYSVDFNLDKFSLRGYKIIQAALEVEMDKIVYVDDRHEYVEIAQSLGMAGAVVLNETGHSSTLIKRGKLSRDDLTHSGMTVLDHISDLSLML